MQICHTMFSGFDIKEYPGSIPVMPIKLVSSKWKIQKSLNKQYVFTGCKVDKGLDVPPKDSIDSFHKANAGDHRHGSVKRCTQRHF